MSESDIALITQTVVSMATINVNVAVNDEVVVDGGVPRKNVAHPTTYVVVEVDDTLGRVARVGNESASGVFMEVVVVNESVVDPPSKDATCEALVGQVAYEVHVRETYTFTESEHESPECGIPPGSTVVEIGDDDKTPVVYRRTRNRRPGKAQQSPFVIGYGLRKFGSVSIKRVKDRSPLIPSITVPVDYELIQAFLSFVNEEMITKMGSVAVYFDDDDYLELSYDFEVSSVSKKTCPQYAKAIRNAIKPYSVLLPIFLATIEFYSKRDDIVMVDGLHQGNQLHDELDVIMVENLPQ
ncbi:hypothetical protein HAX54_012491 [Datura stramonium]|uniref:Uncharacterized protein n=1 Tax=Datura stramonium TaxID=4076 RepID=A0ABS8Y3Z2_DATST|nr:hypothetical protein [Datura stramonium]